MLQRCGRDYIKETGIFFQHSAARRGNGAKPEGTSLLWRHDNTANALFSFWQRQISRWRRRWYRQTGEGGTLSSDYSFFLSMSALAQVHVVIMYTHKTTVLLWCSGLCDIRVLFLYNVCQYVWRIASIRFNNVSLRPLILIPNMSGMLCPLLLNPGSRFASWMRANHYPSRASRNECSNIGACSLHATQVPNSCRKWHNIYILVLIQSPLYMSHTTLRWVVNVLRFPSMPMRIEVWAVYKLTFVLLTFAILYTLIDRSSV